MNSNKEEMANDETKKPSESYKIYKRRWAFLATVSALQILNGFSFACYGQLSNVFVAYYNVAYFEVDWLTLTMDVGPIILTIPFSWFMVTEKMGFKSLILTAAFASTIGYVCVVASVAKRWLFPLTIVGQIFNSVSSTAMLMSPSVFAVLWFPENEVGSAIGINVMSFYLGQTFAFTVLTNVLTQPPSNLSLDANVTINQSWLVQDRWNLYVIFSICLCIATICAIFLSIYVTDRPPTPPTFAQSVKQNQQRQTQQLLSLESYIKLVKALLKNKTFLLAAIVFATLFQVSTVLFTMLSEILRQMFHIEKLNYNADVMGGYIITAFGVGSCIGSIAGGKLVDRYKRYGVISITSCLLTLLSTAGFIPAFAFGSLSAFFVCSALYGVVSQPGIVAIYEIATQETYPINETFCTVWLTGFQALMAILYGEIGRLLFNASGGLSVLMFQCANFIAAIALSCLFSTKNKRLSVENHENCNEPNVSEHTMLLESKH